ncbi:ABC transporter ATP-binding protein [Citrobacter koseri]|uniref:ABC transporter ATP-binding protein n=1 Tax=Citrobacter koseri TaxID=545 RepID=A0A2X2V785_CITKO|nr:ABC transporter ATP-binding protein [Citrobacter koseri]
MHTRTVAQNVAFSLKSAGWSAARSPRASPKFWRWSGWRIRRTAFRYSLAAVKSSEWGLPARSPIIPDVLLCDEPTSALDLETSATILALLKQINEQLGITIVLITHEMNVIKSICDRVAVMSGGKVVESGDVFDVFAHPQHAFTQQLVSHTLQSDVTGTSAPASARSVTENSVYPVIRRSSRCCLMWR